MKLMHDCSCHLRESLYGKKQTAKKLAMKMKVKNLFILISFRVNSSWNNKREFRDLSWLKIKLQLISVCGFSSTRSYLSR